MNKNKAIIAAAIISLFNVASASAADQGHGTVTFSGAIIDSPCSISPDSVDQTVDLGQISNVALAANEGLGTSIPRPFQIELEQCSTETAGEVTATFTGPSGVHGLGITGTAKGASIVLTDGTGKAIVLGEPTQAQVLQDGYNTLSFSAYLQGDGVAADILPGEFQSIANFSLAYN